MLRLIGFLALGLTLYLLYKGGSILIGILLGLIGCTSFITAELKSPSQQP